MRAVVQDTYGSADVLRLATIDTPAVGARDVLVRVQAAGLDRGTWHLMVGKPYLLRLVFGLRGPKQPVPGHDVAGTVAAIGSAVTSFAVGDQVYGFGNGTFAEYTVAREDKLALKPTNVSFEQAAAVPVSAGTALQALVDVGRVKAGQKVLITGASGGVGTYAVQLAKAYGAEVTGVSSTAKLDLVRSLGADHVIDYTREDFTTGSERYDLILDIAGMLPLSTLRRDAHAVRHPRPRRRRRGRRLDRRHDRAAAASPDDVVVRAAAADQLHRQGTRQRRREAHRAHREWPGDPEHRPDLPAGRGTCRHAAPRGRPGPRQGRHHHGDVAMIRVESVTKRYHAFTAVDDVTFTADSGRVTGFLGPNGAGKSTTLRVLVGLTPATAGTATIVGRRFADLPNPGLEVGVLLDASAQHAGRTGREILTLAQRTMGVPASRVEEMLDLVSLTPTEAGRRVRHYSLGMRQRLGIAAALLGQPEALILDEPANGLDPAGIRWMRDLLRDYANRGATVLLSSHLLHEIEVIADDLVVIGNGRIVAKGSKADLLQSAGTIVRTTDLGALARALTAAGLRFSRDGATGDTETLRVEAEPGVVGHLAHVVGAPLLELRPADGAGLEDLFLELTADTQREGAAA